ncbi:TPA: hypothetical protein DDW69_01920 [candidate division CPR2 bacterium]|uniref:Uncharacterized protein n=1 Tax=candidate division CPR2 bacterium GW2011_GWC1_41_48 TaxID=1618344 RepID=A0A0G0W9Y7_UNCC2|nr:MAG: hypothetical protein UT47_C0001G0185 [candidate division CPR2 bacterium GW2011_GWC2_39_35]KKR28519.1 MAG: hypothetical protein UT59_C0025G0006 [candidate division CPR2 bacterium GW2011_GWD1_39_7]KKR28702.1 MAG: hypothetical protein UT60_C0014G0013 [candidate division CPR2 bacterium GW2011_GWD2_39_7]KKS09780.1 MAG: hypothetical protein UU65_C0001G0185 [candidate division CPR2 bacterium GW2011_GWC1_41_48]OGB60985.1 MAG: hypothetical protein A2Y27_03425 [candidate division CPR2 bacterium G
MKDEISTKKALGILAKTLPQIIYTTILGLTQVNPVWSILFYTGLGMVNAWGSFGQVRINELVTFIDKHRDQFLPDIIKSEKFKSIFLNILDAYFKETLEEKRKLLRNYLLNVGKGIEKDFDYHTKLMTVLNQITFDELKVISIWNGKLQDKFVEKNSEIGYTRDNIEEKMTNLNAGQIAWALGREEKGQKIMRNINFLVKSLGNYGLLDVRESTPVIFDSENNNSTVVVDGISDFGKAFLGFLKED